jgi:hypothetical protein
MHGGGEGGEDNGAADKLSMTDYLIFAFQNQLELELKLATSLPYPFHRIFYPHFTFPPKSSHYSPTNIETCK